MSNDVFMVKFAAFRDQLTTDNPSFPTLEALWFSTFKQSLPDNLKQNEWQGNVSAGSSNMVKTEVVNFNKDMIDNEENEIEEIKIAVRISKKNKKRDLSVGKRSLGRMHMKGKVERVLKKGTKDRDVGYT